VIGEFDFYGAVIEQFGRAVARNYGVGVEAKSALKNT
jgi:hypothetical protein